MKLSHILISTVIMTVIFPNPTTIALLSLKLTNKCVKCKLLGVNIQNADLSGADLRNADLRWAKLSVVNLNEKYQALWGYPNGLDKIFSGVLNQYS